VYGFIELMPEFLKKFLDNKIIEEWDKLTVFIIDHNMPKTSNQPESCFSITKQKEWKKRFKTKKEILNHCVNIIVRLNNEF
jgi:hypothetical protein